MRRLVGVLAGVVLATGSLVAVGVTPAGADSFSVNDDADYRAALSAPPSGPRTIEITADFTITQVGDPTYAGSQPLTINGNGHTLDGNDSRRILNSTFPGAGLLTIDGLTLTKGKTSSSGGAIAASGAVTVTDSTFTNNQTTSGVGGAIVASGAVTVTDSTFTGNRATNGSGGAILAGGAATVTDSTFTGNTAAGNGGAIFALGAATVTNSTFTGNTAAGNGGAIFASPGAVTVTDSTFTGNTASDGSAIYTNDASITLFGSVFIKPPATGDLCPTLRPSATSLGYNYANESMSSCGLTETGDNSSNANDPLLGPLADNGGPTWTRLPQSGSPLIDAIPNANCGDGNALAGFAVTTDQRHLVRPEQSGGKCDIGAVEVQLPPAPAPAAPVEVVIRFTG